MRVTGTLYRIIAMVLILLIPASSFPQQQQQPQPAAAGKASSTNVILEKPDSSGSTSEYALTPAEADAIFRLDRACRVEEPPTEEELEEQEKKQKELEQNPELAQQAAAQPKVTPFECSKLPPQAVLQSILDKLTKRKAELQACTVPGIEQLLDENTKFMSILNEALACKDIQLEVAKKGHCFCEFYSVMSTAVGTGLGVGVASKAVSTLGKASKALGGLIGGGLTTTAGNLFGCPDNPVSTLVDDLSCLKKLGIAFAQRLGQSAQDIWGMFTSPLRTATGLVTGVGGTIVSAVKSGAKALYNKLFSDPVPQKSEDIKANAAHALAMMDDAAIKESTIPTDDPAVRKCDGKGCFARAMWDMFENFYNYFAGAWSFLGGQLPALGCKERKGYTYASKCKDEPMAYACMDCKDRLNMACELSGVILSDLVGSPAIFAVGLGAASVIPSTLAKMGQIGVRVGKNSKQIERMLVSGASASRLAKAADIAARRLPQVIMAPMTALDVIQRKLPLWKWIYKPIDNFQARIAQTVMTYVFGGGAKGVQAMRLQNSLKSLERLDAEMALAKAAKDEASFSQLKSKQEQLAIKINKDFAGLVNDKEVQKLMEIGDGLTQSVDEFAKRNPDAARKFMKEFGKAQGFLNEDIKMEALVSAFSKAFPQEGGAGVKAIMDGLIKHYEDVHTIKGDTKAFVKNVFKAFDEFSSGNLLTLGGRKLSPAATTQLQVLIGSNPRLQETLLAITPFISQGLKVPDEIAKFAKSRGFEVDLVLEGVVPSRLVLTELDDGGKPTGNKFALDGKSDKVELAFEGKTPVGRDADVELARRIAEGSAKTDDYSDAFARKVTEFFAPKSDKADDIAAAKRQVEQTLEQKVRESEDNKAIYNRFIRQIDQLYAGGKKPEPNDVDKIAERIGDKAGVFTLNMLEQLPPETFLLGRQLTALALMDMYAAAKKADPNLKLKPEKFLDDFYDSFKTCKAK